MWIGQSTVSSSEEMPSISIPHHRTADVIGVIVRGEHAGDRHVVGADHVDQFGGSVGRVDEHALTGVTVADRIHEVDHLRRELVALGEVASREELTEVQTVVVGSRGCVLGHRASVR